MPVVFSFLINSLSLHVAVVFHDCCSSCHVTIESKKIRPVNVEVVQCFVYLVKSVMPISDFS